MAASSPSASRPRVSFSVKCRRRTISTGTPRPGANTSSISDGEAREIGAGEVVLVEDTTGKGHLSQALAGQIRHCIFVPVE